MINSFIQDNIKSCLRRAIDKIVKLTGGGEHVADILTLDTRLSLFMFVYLSVTLMVPPLNSETVCGARRSLWGQ